MGDMVSSASRATTIIHGLRRVDKGVASSCATYRVGVCGRQYAQLVRSAPAGAVLRIRSAIFGMNIWW